MTEAVTVTLSPDLAQKLNEFRREGDAGYEDVISRVLAYLTDADNYVTEEERDEILASIAEGKEKGSSSSENIRAMIDKNLHHRILSSGTTLFAKDGPASGPAAL